MATVFDRMTQIAPAYSIGPIILKIPFRLIEQVDMNTYYLVPTYYSPAEPARVANKLWNMQL